MEITTQKAKFMRPTRGLPGSCRPQMGPVLAPLTLLSGNVIDEHISTIPGNPYPISNNGWWLASLFMMSNPTTLMVNTLRPRQNGRHFADDIFKCIFLNENVWIPIKISLKFVPEGPINNIPALVQIMAWRRPGDKPLSEPMMVSLTTHVCVTRPQWVKHFHFANFWLATYLSFLFARYNMLFVKHDI